MDLKTPADPAHAKTAWRRASARRPYLDYLNGLLVAVGAALVATGVFFFLVLPDLKRLQQGLWPHMLPGFLAAMAVAAMLVLAALWIAFKLVMEPLFGLKFGKD
jgi:hypothetical protein